MSERRDVDRPDRPDAHGSDVGDDAVRDPAARWPSEADLERGGITTSSPHTVPTVTPRRPGDEDRHEDQDRDDA